MTSHAVETVDLDYAVDDPLSVETDWDTEKLSAKEMPEMCLVVGNEPGNVAEANA